MKKIISIVIFLLSMIPFCSFAGQVTASWDLSIDDPYLGTTGGYKLYIGKESGNLPTVFKVGSGIKTMVITLPIGNYFAAMTTFDSNGLESVRTDEISFQVLPGRPNNLKIIR